MKYEKIPTEDYDDDAQELSVELATNVDSDEERNLDVDEEGSSSGASPGLLLSESNNSDDELPTTSTSKKGKFSPRRHDSRSPLDAKKKRGRWVRHLHIFLFLLFTAVVVFTFLPSAVKKLIVWRHNKLYGGSCHDEDKSLGPEDTDKISNSDKKGVNLLTTPSVSYNPLKPYIQLSNLPSEYIPTPVEQKPRRHLIFIGDIHGMLDEFQELMQKLESKGFLERAHIVVTGDFISKGPDSVPLLDTLISMNVSCVRGNHEDELMRVYWKLQTKSDSSENGEGEDLEVNEVEGVVKGSEGKGEKEKTLGKRDDNDGDKNKDDDESKVHEQKHKKHENKDKKKKKHKHKHKNKHKKKYKHSDLVLAKSLKPHHANFIDSCPLILKLNNVSNLGDVAVVHAGMMPGVELEHQRPSVVMNVRTFVKKHPTSGRKGLHWSKMWNEFMAGRPKGQKPLTVVYGHDARRGLDIKKYTKGLDTNCVRGGRLTALVVEGGKHEKTSIVNVKCRKYLD
ncbi:uncharacterized protein DFL_006851 [Arthrobotrys flagrans]|uniref:Calcineurin-like phosphoesterase domain-containing protein n=1 Tax=Arthrobotrys flagrans TaxID=97331 RepID=A0A436ZTZ3_ARTFL|nr:hypothetical protein DFL_006851 [Arthrobotrys flagrans]